MLHFAGHLFCIWLLVLLQHELLHAHQVLELESNTFEVSLTAFQYLAILFYDSSDRGRGLEMEWEDAAKFLGNTLPADTQMAKIMGSDPELKEIVDAYGITVPSILVFRKGILVDYRGPHRGSESIAKYILEDAKPSVGILHSLDEIKLALNKAKTAVVLGFFKENESSQLVDDNGESMLSENWGQYLATADTLRGHMEFYAISSLELLESFSLQEEDLPTVYLFSGENDGLSRYTGPLIDTSLTEWLLRNVSPMMGELSLANPSSQQYAAQFFSSRKLKFILFVPDDLNDIASDHNQQSETTREIILSTWASLSKQYRNQAIFSYMSTTTNPIADVVDYFDVDLVTDTPCIVAHHPVPDSRYKSRRLKLQHAVKQLADYVEGVVSGRIVKIIRSEMVPKQQRGLVVKAVGNNVLDIVSQPETDVLLVIYASHQVSSKQVLPWLEMLAKAVQGEKRIVISKIDAGLNDLPVSWGIKTYPALVWFPAKDKPYSSSTKDSSERDLQDEDNEGTNNVPVPRPYWDAGYSLQELVSFVTRESSFERQSLRIATTEQLNSLQQDEDMYRMKFEEDDRYERRNEGREVYSHDLTDYFLGEVVFDGKRWHIAAIIFTSVWCALTTLLLILQAVFYGNKSNNISTAGSIAKKTKRS